LDSLAFPSRELFDNEAYKKYYLDHFGYSTSAMITSRGCPFSCDFCSRPIFGTEIRSRSVSNIVDEVKQIAIFNMFGEQVFETSFSGDHIKVDIGDVPDGIYNIKVIFRHSVASKNLMILH